MKESKVVIICVWYNPDRSTVSRWMSIAKDICDVIIVDNSHQRSLSDLEINKSNIIYVPLGDNKGIAYAQNIGIDIAKDKEYKKLIFFDQDSLVSNDLIIKLTQEFCRLKNQDSKLAALGPSLVEINTGETYKGGIEYGEVKESNSIISSGMITDVEILDKVGGMNEKLFIDLVDHEWCWRTRSKGYRIYKSGNIVLPHQVGKGSIKLLGISILISAPKRYYYQYRNTIWLLKCSYAPMNWKIKSCLRKFVEFFIAPFKTGNICGTYKYISQGIKDGLKYKLT